MTVSTGWERALADLDAALASGDSDAVSAITIDDRLGPIPPHLAGRASNVLDQIFSLQRVLTTRRDAVGAELQKIGHRGRRNGPPAPSQLDCSA